MLTWNDFLLHLDREKITILAERSPMAAFRGYQLLLPGMHAASGDYLYLMDASHLSSISIECDFSAVLFQEDANEISSLPANLKNCVAVNCDHAAAELVQVLNTLLEIQYSVDDLLHRLQNMAKQNQGLQRMVDAIAAQLDMPVDVLDNSFRFLATSGPQGADSQVRREFAKPGGNLPTFHLDELRHSGELQRLIQADDCVMLENPKYVSWTVPMIFSGVRVGYFVAFDTPGGEKMRRKREYLSYLPLIASVLSVELSKQSFYILNKGSYFNYVLSPLLDGKTEDVEEIRSRLRLYDYELGDVIYLLRVEHAHPSQTKAQQTIIADSVKALLNNSLYVNKEGRLYFLVSRPVGREISLWETQMLEGFLRSNDLWAGGTGPFHDFSRMAMRCEETELALRTARQRGKDRYVWFGDCQVDALLQRLRQDGDLDHFCYPPVLRLIEYDRQHNTPLVDTLRFYLMYPKEHNIVSEHLHIHKNTLYLRLAKIRSVMGSDFDNAEEIMKIQLTFHLLGYTPFHPS